MRLQLFDAEPRGRCAGLLQRTLVSVEKED
jgi:hypothetical protein